MSDDISLFDLFREEARAQSAVLSAGLVALEEKADDPRAVEPLMRAAHSLKGAARIVNLEAAVRLAHVMEDALVAAQNGKILITAVDVDALLRGADLLASLGDVTEAKAGEWGPAHQSEIDELTAIFRAMAQGEIYAPSLAACGVASVDSSAKPQAARAETDIAVIATETPHVRMPVGPVVPAVQVITPQPIPQDEGEAVVRVTAGSLTRLMGLAGESLVQARWLQPFSTALLKLKKQQDHLAALLDALGQAHASGRRDQIETLLDQSRQQSATCRSVLVERMGEFEEHAARAEDLNTRLYREVIASRMRPFADGAHSFPRLVRDMSRQLDKQVRLDIDGQTTEVDRDILERLEAPLTHLLRNAIDHGIESPEERRATGKPEQGTIRLEVKHRAGMLAIAVGDDGRGIHLERLRQKIVEKNLTSPELVESMTEAELVEFLFLPGFSTARGVTEYSGRGVGLDVVQDTIRKVGGSVRVTSKLGQGTTFHLCLPLTLSVLRAVLVDIAGEPYAFPHNRINRLMRVASSEVRSLEHRQFISVDGHNVGLVIAAQLLDLPACMPAGGDFAVVLLSDETGHYGLVVDAFKGEQDLVVRPLDARLGKVPNVSAASILDDGMPVLIADVEDMIRSMDQYIQLGTLRRCDEGKPQERRKKRVLVVDDSITVREVERQLLRNHGYDTSIAVDGADGWNQARAGGYDLIVTDVDMPRMTGLELVKAIRNDERLKNVPVIIVSYKDREEDRLRGLELGANFYLTKSSFQDNTFLRVVADLIGEP